MSDHQPYQVMPPLSADEYAALKADIEARGVLVPVEYDEAGNILDGHHRVQICGELGLAQWPRLIRHGLSHEQKRSHARRLNLDRRHLDREQRRQLIAEDLREHPAASDRAIGQALNVDGKTVGSVRRELESTAEIPQLTEREGRDRRTRKLVQFVPATDEEKRGLLMSAKAVRFEQEAGNREKRRNLVRAIGEATALSPEGPKVGCVYGDPPWQRKGGVTDRSYENHYPTMSWDAICAMPVKDRLQPDAWLFLWIPRAHMFALHTVEMEFADDDGRVIIRKVQLPLAWAVARAWGFDDYSTAFIWTKTDEEFPAEQGGGVLVYDQDEVLLMFKRGRGLPKPATDEKFKSNFRERTREHSRKPDHYREMIRTMTGGVPVLELFARVDAEHPLPPDWIGFGNQAASPEETVECARPADVDVVPPTTSPAADAPDAANLGAGPSTMAATGPLGWDWNSPSDPADDSSATKSPADVETVADDGDAVDVVDYAAREIGFGAQTPAESRAEYDALGTVKNYEKCDGPIAEVLRGRKLIKGKTGLKLTKLGAERYQVLSDLFDHLERLNLLPSNIPQLSGLYGIALHNLHEAVLAGDAAGAAEQALQLELLQERANGNTHFGMACDDSPAEQLRFRNRAPLGQEPAWQQRGVFRLVVDGVPHIVTQDDEGDLAVHAEDPDKPFLSETGYRSMTHGYALGLTVAQHAEAQIRYHMLNFCGGDGKSKPRNARTAMVKPATVYRLPTGAETEPVPVEICSPLPALSERDALKAISDFCYPRRAEILPSVAPHFVELGLAYRTNGKADDWSLTKAGWERFRTLDAEHLAQRLAAAADPAPEVVDGVLQCRLPLDEAELERHRALTAIVSGVYPEGEIFRDLVGVGFADVDGELRPVVTPDGEAWLRQFVDAQAPKPKTIPAPDLPLFAATRPVNASSEGATTL